MTLHSSNNIEQNIFQRGQFIVIDKPLEWTSFDVVKRVRGLLAQKTGVKRMKVGHAGTLDPLATGVVVLCTGKYTKRIEEIQAQPKSYVTTLRFGATTPTYDLEKEVDEIYPWEHITQEKLEEILERFIGIQAQVPPIFSAVKVDGQRAYHLARQGEEFKLKAKEIVIHGIELLDCSLPDVTIKVRCGKGTYIRSLARDIGLALESGAHLTALRRTEVGAFNVEEALSMEEVEGYITRVLEKETEYNI